MSGVDLATVMEFMGHFSLDMVQRYVHLSPDHKRWAMNRLQSHRDGINVAPNTRDVEGSLVSY